MTKIAVEKDGAVEEFDLTNLPADLDLSHIPDDLIDLSAAAAIVGVTAQTLRRMESRGKITSRRTPGGSRGSGHRRYRTHEAIMLARKRPIEQRRGSVEATMTAEEIEKTIPADDAAKLLGVSRPTLRRWEREGKLVSYPARLGKKVLYDRETIEALVNTGA